MFHGNPFPGLRPFQFDENFLFFGREEQVAQLLQRLANTRFLSVVGASGSGKSSLVRAGLLPELHGGTMTSTSIAWEIAIMRPGGDPLTNLADSLVKSGLFGEENEENTFHTRATLSRSGLGLIEAYRQSSIGNGDNLLLLVDQFEEIFRFRQSGSKASQEAAHFIQLLLDATRQSEVPIFIILTMRSDFLGDCAEFKGLAEAVNEGEYLIPRLNRKQRARAIEGPVKVGGGELSPRLKQQLLNDIGDDPDQLPILQHALMRMWNYWETNSDKSQPLDLEHYDGIGRMAEGLSRHADEVYKALPDDQHRLICMKLFKAITEKQADGRGIRRPLPFREIEQITGHEREKMLNVIDAFRPAGRTFIMPNEIIKIDDNVIIDISHESLMRVWGRLKQWVNEEADSARIYTRLCETAELHSQGEAGFYRDPDLKIALLWRENNKPNENWGKRINDSFDLAMHFLEDSKKDFETEQNAKEEARVRELEQARALAETEKQKALLQSASARRFRTFSFWLTALTLLVAFFAFTAYRSTQLSKEQLVNAAFIRVDQYLDQDRPDLALELLVKTYKEIKDDSKLITKIGAILSTYHFPKHAGIIHNAGMGLDLDVNAMRGFTFSESGNLASCVSNTGSKSKVKILDLTDYENVLIEDAYDSIFHAEFSRDEKLIAVSGRDQGDFKIKIYSLESEDALLEISGDRPSECGEFSHDNKLFYYGDHQGKIKSVDVSSGLVSEIWHLNGERINRLNHNPSKDQIFAYSLNNGKGRLHEITQGMLVGSSELPHTDGFFPVGKFSKDGNYYALGLGNFSFGDIRVYEGGIKNLLWHNSSIHKRHIIGIDISSSNDKIVTASLDKTAYIMNLRTGDIQSPAMQHDVYAWFAKFSRDDSKVVTTTDNNGLMIWDSNSGTTLTTPFYAPDTILDVRFSDNGKFITCGLLNGEVQQWDVYSGRPLRTVLSHDSQITAAAVSTTGKFVVTGDGDGRLKLWEDDQNYLVSNVTESSPGVGKISISDSEDMFGVCLWDGINSWKGYKVYDKANRNLLYENLFDQSQEGGNITALTLSPNMKLAAYSERNEDVINLLEIENPANKRSVASHDNIIWNLVFSPDSYFVASVSQDGTCVLFNVEDQEAKPKRLDYKFGLGGKITFAPNSKRIAAYTVVGSDKNIVRVWDTYTTDNIANLVHGYGVETVKFTNDGRYLFTASGDSYLRLWDLEKSTDQPEISLKHDDRVNSISEFPGASDRNYVLTVTDNGTVRVWDIEAQKIIFGPIKNRKEVAPWERVGAFVDDGASIVFNHSKNEIHIHQFPYIFLEGVGHSSALDLAYQFINMQRGKDHRRYVYSGDVAAKFMRWYDQTENLTSHFEAGIPLSEIQRAYLEQNTEKSLHHSKIVGDGF